VGSLTAGDMDVYNRYSYARFKPVQNIDSNNNVDGNSSKSTGLNAQSSLIVLPLSSETFFKVLPVISSTWGGSLGFELMVVLAHDCEKDVEKFANSFRSGITVVKSQEFTDKASKYEKVIKTWELVHEKYIKKYDWFVMIDAYTYINSLLFRSLLRKLSVYKSTDYFFGVPASITDLRYCSHGFQVLGSSAVRKLAPRLGGCMSKASTRNLGIEFSKCASMIGDFICESLPIPVYQSFVKNINDVTTLRNQHSEFPVNPPDIAYKSVAVRPFTSGKSILQFHHRIIHSIRPVISPVRKSYGLPKNLLDDISNSINNSCVNNPSQQLLLHPDLYLKECPTPMKTERPNLSNLKAFVLNLPGDEIRAQAVQSAFKVHGIHVERFIGVDGRLVLKNELSSVYKLSKLKPGEIGYRESMRGIFKLAIRQGYSRVMVLDDDALPHCKFAKLFNEMVSDDRCGFVYSENSGGVLLLGSAIWKQGTWPNVGPYMAGWRMVHADMRNHTLSTHCFNTNNRTFGSFGAIYHHSTYQAILDWLDDFPGLPFDFVFTFLSKKGYVNRIAWPNLVIQDVMHKSRVDPSRLGQKLIRAAIHHWTLSDYCGET
jgi:hypothetical protein